MSHYQAAAAIALVVLILAELAWRLARGMEDEPGEQSKPPVDPDFEG